MRIILKNYTPEPEKTCARAAYESVSPGDSSRLINEEFEGEIDLKAMLKGALDRGHVSILEHASQTFDIERTDRSLTHQLVRHRLASYTQKSQRWVGAGQFGYVMPKSIEKDEKANSIYKDTMSDIQSAYEKLIKLGIPQEDARYVLPNATHTNITVTMNLRELRDSLYNLRICNNAQEPIRDMASVMLIGSKITVSDLGGIVFDNVGPDCLRKDKNCMDILNKKKDSSCIKRAAERMEKINKIADEYAKDFIELGEGKYLKIDFSDYHKDGLFHYVNGLFIKKIAEPPMHKLEELVKL